MKGFTCPCGAEIRGENVEEVLKNGMIHIEETGHPMPSPEGLEQIKANIKDIE